jgi:hypothetical protein
MRLQIGRQCSREVAVPAKRSFLDLKSVHDPLPQMKVDFASRSKRCIDFRLDFNHGLNHNLTTAAQPLYGELEIEAALAVFRI